MAENARNRPQLCLDNTGRAPELAGVYPTPQGQSVEAGGGVGNRC